MRHKKLGRRFNRDSDHRQAMFSNMAASLIRHEQIITTLPKAKDLKRVIDKYITLAKRGDLNSRRLAAARLREADLPVSIPMAGQADSLNVAMAAIITLFEAVRQRG